MDKDIAIKVEHLSKTFRIPHEKVSSVRGAVVSAFKTGGYEEFKALDDVSFEVKKGEFFGIIGRNGSGKSTLLKILAGIYQPDHGKVHVNGMISPFLELGIGFNPELSGRDNVYLNATVLGMTKKQIDEKFDSIVAFSELERFIDQKLKNYSSGMQVRLAFAVSIHANRDILLMDEVLAVGDMSFQDKCIREFQKYRDNKKTVLLVTHDILAAASYCDKLMLIDRGEIKLLGKAENVVKEYASLTIVNDADIERKKDLSSEKAQIDGNSYGGVSVERVSVVDKSYSPVKSFQTLEDILVEVSFSIADAMDLVFGIELLDESDRIIFGYHEQMQQKKKHCVAGKNVAIIRLQSVPLLPGTYGLNIGIADVSCRKQYYYAKRVAEIAVVGSASEYFMSGVINIKTDVK